MKDYECPYCNGLFSAEQWNKITAEEFGENIIPIEDEEAVEGTFVCPDCRASVEHHEFGEETENEATELN